MKMKAGGEERREEGCRNRKLVLKKMPKIKQKFLSRVGPRSGTRIGTRMNFYAVIYTAWYPDTHPYKIFLA